MKKGFTFLIAALLLTATHLGWAQTRTEVTDVLDRELTGVTGTTYVSWSDVTSNSAAVYAGQSAGGNESIQLRSNNNNSGIITTASGGTVTSISVTWNAATAANRTLNVYGKNDAYTDPTELYNAATAGELIGTIVCGTSTELEVTDSYAYIGLRSAGGAMYLSEIDITWSAGGTPNPSISASNVDIEYNSTSGSIAYTINNPVSGGSLSASTQSDWLSLGTVSNTSVPFTCSANSSAATRTATVTLTYTHSNGTATKNVTVTQAGNPNATNTIADITAAGTYTVQGTIVAKSARGFIVGDGTGYVYYYNTSYTQADFNIGDMVRLAGSVIVYGGVYEFNASTTITAATSSNYVQENPTVLTGEDMDARVASTTPPQLSNYVQYEGTLSVNGTYYNITDISGATTAKGSISYPLNTDFTSLDGQSVRVTGYYVGISSSTYYNTMIGSIEEITSSNPSISANNVEINYNTTSGSIAYTINNPVSGGTLSASCSETWLTLGTATNTTVPFTCSINKTSSQRVATVTLTYTYSGGTATKNVTVTQDADPDAINTIEDITAAGTYSVEGTIVAKSSRGFIVGDGTGYVYYYNQNYVQDDYNIGDMVRLTGSVVVYGGVFEFNNTTEITAAESSNYLAEDPTVLTGEDMDARVASTTPPQLSNYVQYEGTLSVNGTHYNITDIAGATTAIGSISYPIDTEFTALDGKQVKVTGYYVGISTSTYYNTMIGSIEEVASTTPTIHAENVSLAYDATSGEIPYTITNPVTGTSLIATTDATWISNLSVASDKVTFNATVNNGDEDRTATITLSYNGAADKTVTVTQAHFVIDYAELPFYFDGGRADIVNTDGLTQEGIDSDYGSSPKLKFNTTGDYLLLKFNERPGRLSFDIKGNSFADGTFTVQTSVDGETFTDLDAFTDLTATLQSPEYNDLNENIRYIKWIYTEKVTGNVALGNIQLEQYVEPAEYYLEIDDPEHITITATYGTGNSLSNSDHELVMSGTPITLSLVVEEGYTLESVTVTNEQGAEVALTQSGENWTFVMPSYDVTVSATASATSVAISTIEDITAAGTYTVEGTIVAKSARGFIVGDGTGYVYYYNQNYVQDDYNIGDMVRLDGSVVVYGGVFEFNNTATVTAAENSNYTADNPTVLTGEDMDARVASTTPPQLSSYVQYEGTLSVSGSHYNITDIAGATTAKGSISYPIDTEFTALDGKQVKVTGYYVGISSSTYYNTMIGTVEEVVSTTPTIHAENVSLAYDATSGEIPYTITNPVAGTSLTATTDATWISNLNVASDKVNFTATMNEGTEDRTATITLSYNGAADKTVTVTQEHYVVDFATLPFYFDGGRADIANTDGLTQEGIDSDYGSSPKLKFNTTGDYLLLKFNERPGRLSFDIKGNSFADGTFTVQTSVDGETFTDLDAFTELTTTLESPEYNDLNADVRYIKWIYTNKGSGNVALGNIQLEQYVEPQRYRLTIGNPAHITIIADCGSTSLTNGNSTMLYNGTHITLNLTIAEGYLLDTLIVTDQAGEPVNLTGSNNAWSFYMPNSNVTVNANASVALIIETDTYSLSTAIESGRHYIIVGLKNDEAYAAGQQNNYNRAAGGISLNNGTASVESEAGVYDFVINGPNLEGYYTIYDTNEASTGYLYAASNSSNYLRTRAFNTDLNSQWSIEFGENGVAVIKAQGENARNLMRFNTSGIFSCYGENNTQQDIYLYVKDDEEFREYFTDVTGYGEGQDHWALIASPVNGQSDPQDVNNMLENEYDLYAFNQANQGQEWSNRKADGFNLANGKGYLYANSNDLTLGFAGQPNNNGTVSLTYAQTGDSEHNGWNLIGNPFGTAAYLNRAFYVMNDEGTAIVPSETNGVEAMQGLFVVAANANDNSVTFTTTPTRNTQSLIINLNLGDKLIDRAIVRFDDIEPLAKVMLYKDNSTIFFNKEGKDYAVVNAENSNELPVNVKTNEDAVYTINVKLNHLDLQYLRLTDKLTGQEVDLLKNPTYSFYGTNDEVTERFVITFSEKK